MTADVALCLLLLGQQLDVAHALSVRVSIIMMSSWQGKDEFKEPLKFLRRGTKNEKMLSPPPNLADPPRSPPPPPPKKTLSRVVFLFIK